MANRQETHVYFDGLSWGIYTERAADIRRFTLWFGTPTRRGRDGSVAGWDGLPPDSLRVRRKRKVGPRTASPSSLEGLKRFREQGRTKGQSTPNTPNA